MAWSVEFEPRAFTELRKLDRLAQERVLRFVQNRIAGEENPRRLGKPLTGDKEGLWRYRIGDYRVVCQVQDGRQNVLVLRVAHRKQVYR